MVLIVPVGDPLEDIVQPVAAPGLAVAAGLEPQALRARGAIDQRLAGVLREHRGVGAHENPTVGDAVEVEALLPQQLAGSVEVAGGVCGGDLLGVAGLLEVAQVAEEPGGEGRDDTAGEVPEATLQRLPVGEAAGLDRDEVVVLLHVGGELDPLPVELVWGGVVREHLQRAAARAARVTGDDAALGAGRRDLAHRERDLLPIGLRVVHRHLELRAFRPLRDEDVRGAIAPGKLLWFCARHRSDQGTK